MVVVGGTVVGGTIGSVAGGWVTEGSVAGGTVVDGAVGSPVIGTEGTVGKVVTVVLPEDPVVEWVEEPTVELLPVVFQVGQASKLGSVVPMEMANTKIAVSMMLQARINKRLFIETSFCVEYHVIIEQKRKKCNYFMSKYFLFPKFML